MAAVSFIDEETRVLKENHLSSIGQSQALSQIKLYQIHCTNESWYNIILLISDKVRT
jgi:hypothetical protein